jgi:hypothetical protein
MKKKKNKKKKIDCLYFYEIKNTFEMQLILYISITLFKQPSSPLNNSNINNNNYNYYYL